MNDQELLQEISKKLSILISLELQRNGDVGVQENVARLSRFSLAASDIAEMLGTTSGTVAVAKSRIKNRRK